MSNPPAGRINWLMVNTTHMANSAYEIKHQYQSQIRNKPLGKPMQIYSDQRFPTSNIKGLVNLQRTCLQTRQTLYNQYRTLWNLIFGSFQQQFHRNWSHNVIRYSQKKQINHVILWFNDTLKWHHFCGHQKINCAQASRKFILMHQKLMQP